MKERKVSIHDVRKHIRIRPTKEFDMQLNSHHFTANGHPFVYMKKGNELVDGITGEVLHSYNYAYSLSTIAKDAYKYTKSERFLADQKRCEEWKKERKALLNDLLKAVQDSLDVEEDDLHHLEERMKEGACSADDVEKQRQCVAKVRRCVVAIQTGVIS